MAAKRRRAWEKISLSTEEENESDNKDDTNPNQADLDQADDKYLVELWEEMHWELQVTKWGYSSIHQIKYEIHSSFIHSIIRTITKMFQ